MIRRRNNEYMGDGSPRDQRLPFTRGSSLNIAGGSISNNGTEEFFNYPNGTLTQTGLSRTFVQQPFFRSAGVGCFFDYVWGYDEFTGLSDGTTSSVTSGFYFTLDIAAANSGWLSTGTVAFFDYAQGYDEFTGLSDGTITNVTSGFYYAQDIAAQNSGWLTDGTGVVP